MSKLSEVIIHGQLADVEKLLASGEKIDEIDVYGYTPLIETVIAGKYDIAEFLLKLGAKVDLPDLTRQTPLFWAANFNNHAMCKLFLEYGADPNGYSLSSQPVLAYPLLRGQSKVKNLLLDSGAKLSFAQDYTNTKLLAHRYELVGFADIVNTKGVLIEIEFEGFYLEFTLALIRDSIYRFKKNFAARPWRKVFRHIGKIYKALQLASKLYHYQHIMINYKEFEPEIDRLLKANFMLIPVAYAGHAITFIKYGNIFAKCDRGENSKVEGTAIIYQIQNQENLNKEFLKHLIYVSKPREFVDQKIQEVLGLKPIVRLPISPQITGNCSWANVEGSVAVMLFILLASEYGTVNKEQLLECQDIAMGFYTDWVNWEKDNSLNESIRSFYEADDPARRMSKATILAAVLFQGCHYNNDDELEKAEKILPILTRPEYKFILRNYIEINTKRNVSQAGKNLLHVLDMCGYSEGDFYDE